MEEENPFEKLKKALNIETVNNYRFFGQEAMQYAYEHLSPYQKEVITFLVCSLQIAHDATFEDNKSNSSNHRTHRH